MPSTPAFFRTAWALHSAEAEKTFSIEFTDAVSVISFELFLPNELKSNRTIFVYIAD